MVQRKETVYVANWELKPVSLVEHRNWNMLSVREMCIKHRLFTAGTSDEYASVLNFVNKNEPTAENIFLVAKKINKCSERQTVSNIMYLLVKEACYPTFELDGVEEF